MSAPDPSSPRGLRAWTEARRLARYVLAGGLAAMTHLATMAALVESGILRPVVASVAGFAAGLVVSYTLQRRWVFAHGGRHRQLLPRFLTVLAIALGLNTVIVHLGTEVLTVHYAAVQLVAFGVIPVSNYLLNSRWTFR